MKKLLLLTLAGVLMFFAQVQAASVDTVKAAIVKHSIEMGVDPAITLSIAKTESGYRHEARSAHGAVGVFQLMPSTARRMGLNPYSLDDNIKGGIMYYKSMYKMFGSMELAVAAYNAGPAIVKKYNAVPPYSETKRFVSKIMSDYYYLKAHTDPAVAAYKKSTATEKQIAKVQQAPVKPQVQTPVQAQTQQTQSIQTAQLPKKVESTQFVAQMPETTKAMGANVAVPKAPVPVSNFNPLKDTSLDLPLEGEIQEISVQM